MGGVPAGQRPLQQGSQTGIYNLISIFAEAYKGKDSKDITNLKKTTLLHYSAFQVKQNCEGESGLKIP